MRWMLFILSAVLFVSCGPEVSRPWPEAPWLTVSQRNEIIVTGYLHIGMKSWSFDNNERLNFMFAPVSVVTTQKQSHGVFREKWVGTTVTVKDRFGSLWTLYDTAFDVRPGDVLRGEPE